MSDHHSTSKLDAIFKPTSVAVVGASTRAGTVGNDIFRNLLFNEFNGSVYPINPKANNVLGVHCYPDLLSVPGTGRPGGRDRAVGRDHGSGGSGHCQAGPGDGRHLGRIQGGRWQGRRAGAAVAAEGACGGHSADRPELPGRDQHRSGRPHERRLRPQDAGTGQSGLPVAERCLVHLGAGLRRRTAHGLQQVHQLRQQGRRQRNRSARVSGQRSRRPTSSPCTWRTSPTAVGSSRPCARSSGKRTSRCCASSRAGRRRGPRPSAATPVRWPVPTRSTMPCWCRAACSGWTRSPNCSTRRPCTARNRCRAADAWRSSPTPADRASWPPTRPSASG